MMNELSDEIDGRLLRGLITLSLSVLSVVTCEVLVFLCLSSTIKKSREVSLVF